MGKKLSTIEVHSVLEAARDHHRRELQEQAEKISRLLAYKNLRMGEMEGQHPLPTHVHEKRVYRECAEFLGVPVPEVRRLMDSAETLAENLPRTYALYQRGETDLPSVQKINRAIGGISRRPELMEKLDSELTVKVREMNSAELDNWLKQRVPTLDVKAFEERFERGKQKHYVAFKHLDDGTTKVHALVSTMAAGQIQQMLLSKARNKPRKPLNGDDEADSTGERTHTQRMADIFTNALTTGLQGVPVEPAAETASPESAQLPLAGIEDSDSSRTSNPIPGPTGAAKIGILIPVKTLAGASDEPAISWDRTWMLPASEARAIATDTSVKHDWYAVGVTQDTSTDCATEDEISTGVGEVVTVTKSRTAPASTGTEDIDAWVSKTDPEAQNLLTKTYESRTARAHQRNAVLIRDGQCQTSGCAESGWGAEIDHKQSYETGGATTGENLQTLCKACHDIKSHKHHPPDPHPFTTRVSATEGTWWRESMQSMVCPRQEAPQLLQAIPATPQSRELLPTLHERTSYPGPGNGLATAAWQMNRDPRGRKSARQRWGSGCRG